MKALGWFGWLMAASVVACTSGDDVYIATSNSSLSKTNCCSEFKVGTSVGAEIGGDAQAQVAVQAIADVASNASATIDDLTSACRNMAQELDVPKPEQDANEAKNDEPDRMEAWCKSAAGAIVSFEERAGGPPTVAVVTPKCSVSISAKTSCQAKCSASAACDRFVNPPRCPGGTLWIACKGDCTTAAGATLSCEGRCNAECQGSCSAPTGVPCAGRCEGTCKGTAEGGTGTGIKADGTCDGTCEGTCAMTAKGATCSGFCKGVCGGSCTGMAGASVTCDGLCSAVYEPLECEGGQLEGGCAVDANCDGDCNAIVWAQARCAPPKVTVTFSGAADIEPAARLKAVLESNLGIVFACQARLKGIARPAATLAGRISALVEIKPSCIPAVAAAALRAAADITAASSATARITSAATAQ